VEALQAMRGVSLIAAVTLVSELGDLSRFDHPQQLMAYLVRQGISRQYDTISR